MLAWHGRARTFGRACRHRVERRCVVTGAVRLPRGVTLPTLTVGEAEGAEPASGKGCGQGEEVSDRPMRARGARRANFPGAWARAASIGRDVMFRCPEAGPMRTCGNSPDARATTRCRAPTPAIPSSMPVPSALGLRFSARRMLQPTHRRRNLVAGSCEG